MKKFNFWLLVLGFILIGMPVFSAAQRDTEAPATGPVVGSGAPGAPFSYPITSGGRVTYWQQVQGVWASNFSNLGHTPMAQRLMQLTGVEIEYLHPPAGTQVEAFNLMVASGEYPDIIQFNFHTSFPGGATRALNDGIVIPLNDVIDRWAPNLRAFLNERPDIDRSVRTDDGYYYTFPFVRGHDRLLFSSGPIIRKDWLDDLGFDLPRTLDEVYRILVAFRDIKGASAPYTAAGGATGQFVYPFGQEGAFYVDDDGRVRHGALEPGYRRYLETMAQWYREGLLDGDLFSVNAATATTKITTGVSGISAGSINAQMMTWNIAGRRTDPNFTLAMFPALTLNQGERPRFSNGDLPYGTNTISMTGISTQCSNVELAARFLDFGYTHDGHMLFNFGIEGTTYTMVNGVPTYTDYILNNPQGISMANILGGYALAGSGGPFVQNVGVVDQGIDQYEAVIARDTITAPWILRHKMPIISLTPAESSELAQIMSGVNTFISERNARYILGTEAFSTYDNYMATLRSMGLPRAIEIQNAALTRFNRR